MRVTSHGFVDKAITNLQKRLSQLGNSQGQISSGHKVNRPSDDPSATPQLIDLQSRASRADQYQRNIQAGMGELRSTDDALGNIRDLVTRVRALTIQGANDSLSADDRAQLAQQTDQLLGELLDLANQRSSRGYLFGGGETRQAPYKQVTDDNGQLVDIRSQYNSPPSTVEMIFGDGNRTAVTVGAGDVFDLGNGDTLFKTLFDLRQALHDNNAGAIGDVLPRLDEAAAQLDSVRSMIGVRIQEAQGRSDRLSAQKNELSTRISDLGDVDLAEAITRLTEEQNSYQVALQTTASVLQTSLINFITA